MCKLGSSPFMNFGTAVGIGRVNCKRNCEEKKKHSYTEKFWFCFVFCCCCCCFVFVFVLFCFFSTKMLYISVYTDVFLKQSLKGTKLSNVLSNNKNPAHSQRDNIIIVSSSVFCASVLALSSLSLVRCKHSTNQGANIGNSVTQVTTCKP